MKRLFQPIKMFFSCLFLVMKKQYKFTEKIEILRVLYLNYFSVIIYRLFKIDKKATRKIFQYNVIAYDYQTLDFLFREIFLSNEYLFHSQKETPVIIDCGANIGMSVLFFKMMYPKALILAFEPNPYAFKLLEKNVKQNKLENVQLFNIGLSDRNGSIDFFMNDNNGTLVGSLIQKRGGDKKLIIETNKLSHYIANLDIDLIKMDIEGAEIMVIDDLSQAKMINRSNNYIIEYHHKIDSEKSKLSHFLKTFEDEGFEYNMKTNYIVRNSFQDILINLFKENS